MTECPKHKQPIRDIPADQSDFMSDDPKRGTYAGGQKLSPKVVAAVERIK